MSQVIYQITGKCNEKCKFCSDALSYQKESEKESIIKMIERLSARGLKKIQITGGEPLLYKDLEEVLKAMKENGLIVSLSTNGILLQQKQGILKYIDEIILPLDAGFTKTLDAMGRVETQLTDTIVNSVLIKEKHPNIKLTIGTVLTDQNIEELENIMLVLRLLIIDEWQVHQFLPHGRGRQNIRDFILDDRDFEKIIAYLKTTKLAEKLKPISVFDKVDTDWIISPNLSFMRLKDDKPSLHGKVEEFDDRDLENIFREERTYRKAISK